MAHLAFLIFVQDLRNFTHLPQVWYITVFKPACVSTSAEIEKFLNPYRAPLIFFCGLL